MTTLVDVKLRVSKDFKEAHFWDGEQWGLNRRPVALCISGGELFPRDPAYFITTKEMKEIPFCQKCLSMIDR